MMKVNKKASTMLTIGLALLVVVIAGILIDGKINKVSDQEIAAPGKDWPSQRKVRITLLRV